ncbi:MAG: heavy-metal-associated domain-containing protein [Phycisphaerales bacterium]
MFRTLSITALSAVSILALSLGLAGCGSTPEGDAPAESTETASTGANAGSDTVLMTVYGMSCPLCATNVDKQLLKIPGVEGVNTNLDSGIITIDISPTNPPSDAALEEAIEESGFTLIGEPVRSDKP